MINTVIEQSVNPACTAVLASSMLSPRAERYVRARSSRSQGCGGSLLPSAESTFRTWWGDSRRPRSEMAGLVLADVTEVFRGPFLTQVPNASMLCGCDSIWWL